MRAVAMNARKYACEHINKMYDLQVDVRWNLDESQLRMLRTLCLPRPLSGVLEMLSTRATRIWGRPTSRS